MGVATVIGVIVKIIVCVLNAIFAFAGATLIVLGLMSSHPLTKYGVLFKKLPVSASMIFITAGALLIITASVGCCGIVRKNLWKMIFFCMMLLVIIGLEVGAVVIAFTSKDKLEEIVWTALNETMGQYKTDNEVKRAWNFMQQDLACCGMYSHQEWGQPLPAPCCKKETATQSCPAGEIQEEGCYNKLVDALKNNTKFIWITALVLILAELVDIAGSCFLCILMQKGEGGKEDEEDEDEDEEE